MPRRVEIYQQSSWEGGLNQRDDAFQIPANELFDILNMEVNPQGGVQRRHGMTTLNTANLTGTPLNVWGFYTNSVNQIVIQVGNTYLHSSDNGATFTNTAALTDNLAGGRMRAAQTMRASTSVGALYLTRMGAFPTCRWNGTTHTVLADSNGAYNENLAAPTGGKAPIARFIVPHLGHLFVAYTKEGATTYQSRIRWSHPGEIEDWRALDFIDIGDDADEIMGLASLQDKLYIFKRRGTWVLSGYDTETYEVTQHLPRNGAVRQEAIAGSRVGLAFFDEQEGVLLIRPNGEYENLSRKLVARTGEGVINRTALTNVTCGWHNDQLYVSVPEHLSTINSHTYVWDAQLGERRSQGAWFKHKLGLGPMMDYQPAGSLPKFLACPQVQPAVWQVDVPGQTLDWRGIKITNATRSGTTVTATTSTVHELSLGDLVNISGVAPAAYNGDVVVAEIPSTTTFKYEALVAPGAYTSGGQVRDGFLSYFQTAWFAANRPGVRKRWRRPSFVVDNDLIAPMIVNVYRDYTNLAPARTYVLNNDPAEGGGVWGVGAWGTAIWGPVPEGEQDIIRAGGIGRAYAVQVRVQGPPNVPWAVNAIDLRYIMTRIR